MMKNMKRLFAVALAAAIFFGTGIYSQAAGKVQNEQTLEEIMLEKINNLREEQGLVALTVDEDLVEVAEIRSKEASQLWSHTRPDGTSGLDLIPRDKWAGENLSYAPVGNENIDTMFTMLCESPTHYDNMVFDEFTHIGIAACVKGNTVYVAYMFSN